MRRKAIDELITWKESNNKRPVLLTGAKGVGKTYLAYDFAKAFFEHIYYIQIKQEPLLTGIFRTGDWDKIRNSIINHFHLTSEEESDTRLLIIDEISYSPELLQLVNKELLSELFGYIICTSSKPISEQTTNKIQCIPIYPLQFDEFLRATGYEWYIDLIQTHFTNNKKLPDIVHKELIDLHYKYLEIGGMPGCLNEYLNMSSDINVSEQHNFLLGSYHDFIQKENSESDALKMNQVLDSLTSQLLKDNKKFQYKLIRKGTTHSMYKEAIDKLIDLNYIIKCNRMSSVVITEQAIDPIKMTQENSDTIFKLYLHDTGLLRTSIIQESNTDKELFIRRALLENYVAQALVAKNYQITFWESDSMAKIDFIIQKENEYIPIELHESSNTRSKCTSIFKQQYNIPYSIKISTKNFEYSNNVKYVPYYAVFCI